jgi:structural maintenance of chromosome 3 (chondroitin sulfate proteoglycan 6)
VSAAEASLQSLRAEEAAAARERDEQTEARRAAWAAEMAASASMRAAAEAVETHSRALHAATPFAVRQGLESVAAYARTQVERARGVSEADPTRGSGVFGPLIDLFRPKHPRYNTAVDQVGGAALFSVVVRDDAVAAAAIRHLGATKGGRVTFTPLSRLSAQAVAYPQDDDVRPLLGFLEFDATVAPAMQQAFGRVLLCRNLAVAAKYAKEAAGGFTCVTLDGDIVERSGAVRGGFFEAEGNRVRAAGLLQEARAKLAADTAAADTARTAALAADQRVSVLSGRLQQLGTRVAGENERRSALTLDAEASRRDSMRLVALAESKARDSSERTRSVAALRAQMTGWEEEMAKDLAASRLTRQEEAELDDLTSNHLPAARQAVAEATAALEAAQSARNALVAQVEGNWRRRLAEAEAASGLQAGGAADASGAADGSAHSESPELAAARKQLAATEADLQGATAALAQCEAEYTQATAALSKLTAQLESERQKLSKLEKQLQDDSASSERLLERRRLALRRREECQARLRGIGAVPAPEVEALKGKRRKELVALLRQCQETLRGFPVVNRKAAEQYASFQRQREELIERKAELDRSDESIRAFVATLDHRKDEAIRRTFKGVAGHFSEVFHELVPKGSASLNMLVRGIDKDEDEDDDGDAEDAEGADLRQLTLEDEGADAGAGETGRKSTAGKKRKSRAQAAASTETYRGLAIHASFTDAGETRNMQQLSGGQKALVALALIFAIQRADPAPFYIFDEVDSALDPTHRAAVAALIRKQADSEESPAQFLLTTFRPELARVADRWFGVQMQNKVSTIVPQSKLFHFNVPTFHISAELLFSLFSCIFVLFSSSHFFPWTLQRKKRRLHSFTLCSRKKRKPPMSAAIPVPPTPGLVRSRVQIP